MKTTSLNKLVDVVILYCKVNGFRITPLKLQKVLYYLQAWHLVKFKNENLFEELPQAWVNGPVYSSVYHQFKESFFRSEDISLDIKGNAEIVLRKKIEALGLEDEQVDFINMVLKHYASKDEGALVLKTHSEKPWNKAREGLKPFERSTNTIKQEWMLDYYNEVASR